MASKGWGKINKLRDKAKSKVQAVAGHSKELTLTPADTEVSYISIFYKSLFITLSSLFPLPFFHPVGVPWGNDTCMRTSVGSVVYISFSCAFFVLPDGKSSCGCKCNIDYKNPIDAAVSNETV